MREWMKKSIYDCDLDLSQAYKWICTGINGGQIGTNLYIDPRLILKI